MPAAARDEGRCPSASARNVARTLEAAAPKEQQWTAEHHTKCTHSVQTRTLLFAHVRRLMAAQQS